MLLQNIKRDREIKQFLGMISKEEAAAASRGCAIGESGGIHRLPAPQILTCMMRDTETSRCYCE